VAAGIKAFADTTGHAKLIRGARIVEKMYEAAAVAGDNADGRGEAVRKLTIRIYTMEGVVVRPGTDEFDYAERA
jgi:hypothetical protein